MGDTEVLLTILLASIYNLSQGMTEAKPICMQSVLTNIIATSLNW